jgi:hypothetical protein
MRILISLVEGSWPGRVRSRAEAALQSVVRSSRPARSSCVDAVARGGLGCELKEEAT